MTECVYSSKLTSFRSDVVPEPVSVIPVMEKGRQALEEINLKMGWLLMNKISKGINDAPHRGSHSG
jgi:hypothetical protein